MHPESLTLLRMYHCSTLGLCWSSRHTTSSAIFLWLSRALDDICDTETRIICVFLFDAPAAHNEALEKVWVDKIVNKVRFQYLIDRTVKDWNDISLLSTVLWTYVD